MFWLQPTLQGVLKTIPFRTGGRSVQMGGSFFMGQVPLSSNRLDAMSIPAIIGRIQLAPVIQAYLAGLAQYNATTHRSGFGYGSHIDAPVPVPNFPPMSDAEKQILFEVSQNPSDEELKDLATIDDLFSQNFSQTYLTSQEVCFYNLKGTSHPVSRFGRQGEQALSAHDQSLSPLIAYFHPVAAESSRWYTPPAVKPPDSSFESDKFWCSDPKTTSPSIFHSYFPLMARFWSFAGMFGIDTSKTWGEVKLPVKNGLIMLGVKASYPLPPILDMAPEYVWQMAAMPHTAELANIGAQVDPEAFRAWYTMAVLDSYDAATNAIINEQKKKAKKNKRKAIIAGIGIAVAGIVLSFIVPGIIAAAISAIKSAVQFYIAEKERQKAAKAMAEAGKMFESDAPAFASEVQKTADMLDSAAAQTEADAPLTKEQLDTIQEVKDNPESSVMPTTGNALVTGGIAAGVIAGMIAIFR